MPRARGYKRGQRRNNPGRKRRRAFGPGGSPRQWEIPPSEREFLALLGERVRGMRLLRDMSRRELARRSRVSERYIAQIEAGKGNVSIVLLLRIAQAIRCG